MSAECELFHTHIVLYTSANSSHLFVGSKTPLPQDGNASLPCNEEVKMMPSIPQNTPESRLNPLSTQQKQQRLDILSELYMEPASIHLQAYLTTVGTGSPWDIDTLISNAKTLAKLCGSERERYYGNNSLKGLHYPNSFAKVWNETYPELPTTTFDTDFKRQCHPSWSYEMKEGRYVLTYQGDAPLTQGLNDLFLAPTTICCGMWCQLYLVMLIRSLAGDELFNRSFPFKKGQFTLTECWPKPMNNAGTTGNLLYDFYDDPWFAKKIDPPGSQRRIQTRTVLNHDTYVHRHPGGDTQLHNCFTIDGEYYFFDPEARQNILSEAEFQHSLMDAYNTPRDFADADRLAMYDLNHNYVHDHFAPKSFGTLAEEAKNYENHTLSEAEWKDSAKKRRERENTMYLEFNFERLIGCLEEAKDAQLHGTTYNALSRANTLRGIASVEIYMRTILPGSTKRKEQGPA